MEIGKISVLIVLGIVIAAIVGVYQVTREGGEEQEISITILGESAPEFLALISEGIFSMYEDENPNINIITDVVPRATWQELVTREVAELTGRYDLIWDSGWGLSKGTVLGTLYSIDADLDAVDPEYLEEISKDIDITQRITDPETGEIMGWPLTHIDSMVLYYRKDLFEDPQEKAAFEQEYGYELAPPDTWEQMRDAAEFFNRPPDLYGNWVCGGVIWDITWGEFLIKVESLTGTFGVLDEDGNVAVNTVYKEAWTEALEFQKELSEFAPPDWQGMGKFDGLALFKQGKLAMHQQFTFAWPSFFNPEEVAPEVLGNIGIVGVPKAPNGMRVSHGGGGGFEFLVPKSAPYPEEAAKFIKWLQRLDVQKKIYMTGAFFMPFSFIAADPEVDAVLHSAEFVAAPGWAETIHITRSREYLVHESEVNPPINEAYDRYMRGDWSADEALSWLQTELEAIFD